jgi:hypothetical protein
MPIVIAVVAFLVCFAAAHDWRVRQEHKRAEAERRHQEVLDALRQRGDED